MTLARMSLRMLALVALVVAGCATGNNAADLPVQRPRIEPPPQPPDSLRLVIYRPQTLVGLWGRPVVVVNGRSMITTLKESMLNPGSVFVVDAPAALTQVQWIQSKQAELNPDPIVFTGLAGETRYLRWTLEPTFGYLQHVGEDLARIEMGPLFYTGYRNIVDTKQK